MMKQHPRDKNVREDNHDHPPREGGKMENSLQGISQQLLNEDGTVKNWDKDINPRVIRDCHELFIREDFYQKNSEQDLEEEFENTRMKIYDGGFKRRIITDQAAWKDVILGSQCRRGWAGTEDCNSEE